MDILQRIKPSRKVLYDLTLYLRGPLFAPIYLIVFLTEYIFLSNDEQLEAPRLKDWIYTVLTSLALVPSLPILLFTIPYGLCVALLTAGLRLSYIRQIYAFYLILLPFVATGLLAILLLSATTVMPRVICSVYLWEPLFQSIVPGCYLRWNRTVYTPLEAPRRQIRVLLLHPGQGHTSVYCTLLAQDVGGPPFEALSYSWGGHRALRARISVNGQSFLVTTSVLRAHSALRDPVKERRLWIDQICINQADLQERNEQVQYCMSEVYRQASQVIVWLGSSPQGLDVAFEDMKAGKVLAGSVELHTPVINALHLQSIGKVLRRRWWGRMWVVQEVALARKLTLKSGEAEVDWNMFCEQVSSWKDQLEIESNQQQLLALRPGVTEPLKQSLLQLVLRFSGRGASDARDALFGLYALANKDESLIAVNYERSTDDVFADFAAQIINDTGSLDILALSQGDAFYVRHIFTDCSWLVRWDKRREFSSAKAFWGPDTSASPKFLFPAYNACGKLRAKVRQHPSNSQWLCVQGLRMSSIKIIGVSSFTMSASFSLVLNAWLEISGLADGADYEDARIPYFWQALTAGAAGENMSYEDAAKLMCPRRRFFVTEEGSYGLGPDDIGVGDSICILAGADVPVVIRRKSRRSLQEIISRYRLREMPREAYKFVGYCFVQGMMDNPGLASSVDLGEIVLEDLWLV